MDLMILLIVMNLRRRFLFKYSQEEYRGLISLAPEEGGEDGRKCLRN
jgi:hypothetical protein